jgi:tetratricopeptide (TPR) repeat protein
MRKITYITVFIFIIMKLFPAEDGPGDLFRMANKDILDKKYDLAMKKLEKIDQEFETFEGIKIEIAKLYIRIGKKEKGCSVYNQALFLENNSDIVFEYGNYLYEQNKFEEALAVYDQDKNKKYKNYIGAALSCKKLNKISDAEEYYKKAIKVNKNTSNTYLLLGKLYYETKDIKKAIKYFAKYVDLDESEKSYILLANMYILDNNENAAKKTLKKGINKFPKSQALNKLLINIVIKKS